MKCSAGLAVFVLSLSGCYSWTAIRPDELPKLNGNYTSSQGHPGGTLVIETVAQLEAPDGRMVEIKGESDARLTTKNPQVAWNFQHPILAETDGNSLRIRSSNLGKKSFELGNIQSLEVSQFERAKTAWAICGPLTVVGIIAILVILNR
jgi:hypothetical protein